MPDIHLGEELSHRLFRANIQVLVVSLLLIQTVWPIPAGLLGHLGVPTLLATLGHIGSFLFGRIELRTNPAGLKVRRGFVPSLLRWEQIVSFRVSAVSRKTNARRLIFYDRDAVNIGEFELIPEDHGENWNRLMRYLETRFKREEFAPVDDSAQTRLKRALNERSPDGSGGANELVFLDTRDQIKLFVCAFIGLGLLALATEYVLKDPSYRVMFVLSWCIAPMPLLFWGRFWATETALNSVSLLGRRSVKWTDVQHIQAAFCWMKVRYRTASGQSRRRWFFVLWVVGDIEREMYILVRIKCEEVGAQFELEDSLSQ